METSVRQPVSFSVPVCPFESHPPLHVKIALGSPSPLVRIDATLDY